MSEEMHDVAPDWVLNVVLREFAYWRDSESPAAVGAVGASANILAALMGHPAPWHRAERCPADAAGHPADGGPIPEDESPERTLFALEQLSHQLDIPEQELQYLIRTGLMLPKLRNPDVYHIADARRALGLPG